MNHRFEGRRRAWRNVLWSADNTSWEKRVVCSTVAHHFKCQGEGRSYSDTQARKEHITHTHTHAHTHTHTHAHTHTHTHTHKYKHTHVLTHNNMHIYARANIHTHTVHTNTCAYIHIHKVHTYKNTCLLLNIHIQTHARTATSTISLRKNFVYSLVLSVRMCSWNPARPFGFDITSGWGTRGKSSPFSCSPYGKELVLFISWNKSKCLIVKVMLS